MHRFPLVRFPRTRLHGSGLLLATAAVLIAIASFAVGPPPAAAQMVYDFNEDGKVTCADFKAEFPDTYTDEATEALQQYPDDLRRLNANAEDNAVACEGQPTDTASAEPSATPQTPEEAPDAETPETASAKAVDVPADVMARVAGCAVVAISSRDVVGAGCPGVGSVAFRIPDDAPSMKGTVLMNSGSPAADAGTAPDSTAETRSSGSGQNDATTENTAKAGKDKSRKKQSADSDNSGNDKNTKDKKDKNDKKKKKSGKNKNKNDGKQKGKK